MAITIKKICCALCVCCLQASMLARFDDNPCADETVAIAAHAQEFYSSYVQHYYPKALAIRDYFFSGQEPHVVAGRLKTIIDLIAHEPWFYVANKPDGFSLMYYWEFFLDQCSLLHAYVRKAFISGVDGRVYIPRNTGFSFLGGTEFDAFDNMPLEPLNVFIKREYPDIYGQFYALCFDYAVKLFNEGVLAKDIGKAERFYKDIETIVPLLATTPYEELYQESYKKVRDLLQLLQRKLGQDKEQMVRELLDADSKGQFSLKKYLS